jgi:hypothetical protein
MVQPLSARAFWDVDLTKVDMERDKDFIIRRVFDRGSWSEMKWCVANYGEQLVKQALLDAPYLREEVMRLCCVIFNLELPQFKCYIRKQQMPIPDGF